MVIFAFFKKMWRNLLIPMLPGLTKILFSFPNFDVVGATEVV